MSVEYGDGVPDSALIMLASQILKRVRVSLPNATRTQALAIIKGVKVPPSKDKPLAKSFRRMSEPCVKCNGPVFFGEPCRICFSGEITQHIECPKKAEKKRDDIYAECVHYVTHVINNPNADK